jgi:hypothetical protein
MRILFGLLFLTFVLSQPLAQAAPSTTTTFETTPLDSQPDPLLSNQEYLESVEKPITSLINISVGYGGGNYLERDENIQGIYFKLLYASLYRRDLPTWDVSLELNKENALGLFWGSRFYFADGDKFYPYAKVAAGTFLDSAGEFASLIDFERYRFRVSTGVGETFCTEMGVGFALTGVDYYLQTGVNITF